MPTTTAMAEGALPMELFGDRSRLRNRSSTYTIKPTPTTWAVIVTAMRISPQFKLAFHVLQVCCTISVLSYLASEKNLKAWLVAISVASVRNGVRFCVA